MPPLPLKKLICSEDNINSNDATPLYRLTYMYQVTRNHYRQDGDWNLEVRLTFCKEKRLIEQHMGFAGYKKKRGVQNTSACL